MAEGNSNNLDNGRVPPEQSVSRQADASSFHLYCQSPRGLGFGIGKSLGSYFFIWLTACLFYVGPFVITYTIFALTAIALFLPLCHIIDMLGK